MENGFVKCEKCLGTGIFNFEICKECYGHGKIEWIRKLIREEFKFSGSREKLIFNKFIEGCLHRLKQKKYSELSELKQTAHGMVVEATEKFYLNACNYHVYQFLGSRSKGNISISVQPWFGEYSKYIYSCEVSWKKKK